MENQEFKGTKGKWYIENEKHFILILAESENPIADIAVPKYFNDFNARKESEANAKLIVEAGNVANETGLTPRQLLQHRDELLAALKNAMERMERARGILKRTSDSNWGMLDTSDLAKSVET